MSTSDSSESEPNVSDTESTGIAKEHFESNSNCLRVLLSMAVGLNDPDQNEDQSKLGDFGKDDRFPKKKKRIWNPTVNDLVKEIKRRKACVGDKSKTNSQMSKEKAIRYLQENPISNKHDKSFIIGKLTTFMKETAAAAAETSSTKPNGLKQWSGMVPFLRLIHAIVDFDDNKAAFLLSNTRLSREELDGRNNEDTMRQCPWILASDKWNDEDFNPKSNIFSDLHDDFESQIDLGHSAIAQMGTLTPKKAQEKFTKLKNELIVVKTKWEASGNGDGSVRNQLESENADVDDPIELELMNANDKKNFLDGRSPAVLYLWKTADDHDMLTSVCNQLNDVVMLDSSSDGDGSRAKDGTGGKKNGVGKGGGGNGGDGGDGKMLDRMRATMEQTNMEMKSSIAAKKEINLMQLIQTEKRVLYDVEDQLDDAVEGTRKWDRLRGRLTDLEQRIDSYEEQLQEIRNPKEDDDE